MAYAMNLMMQKIFSLFKNNPWAWISGILIGTSYIPFPPWALLFCLTPLWVSLLKKPSLSLKEAFLAGWITQFSLTLIGFHWIAYTAHEFGQFPWVLSYATLFLFCSLVHLYIPLSVTFGLYLKQRFQLSNLRTLFLFALLHSLLERVWPSIFPWSLSYSFLGAQWPLFQWADLLGFNGLSTLTLLSSAAIGGFFFSQRKWMGPSLAIASFLILNFTGELRKKAWNQSDSVLNILAVQGNIGNFEKVFAEKGVQFRDSILEKYFTLSNQGLSNFPETQVLIWPETAMADTLDTPYLNKPRPARILSFLKEKNKALLTGGFSHDNQIRNQKRADFNALFLMTNNSSVPYRKTQLLIFGEYLPLSDTFPILLKWLPFIANFGRGPGPSILSWETNEGIIRFGPQICYEGLDAEFSRGLALKGAQILANVTNDSWFGTTFEPHQHSVMTLARAVENRRPLIRSTNTGITSAILANGERLQESPLQQEWTGLFVIPYLKEAPLSDYTAWGHYDWILWLALTFLLIFVRTRRERST